MGLLTFWGHAAGPTTFATSTWTLEHKRGTVTTDISEFVHPASLRFTERDAGRSARLDVKILDPSPVVPQAWDELYWTVDGERYFGGYIIDIQPRQRLTGAPSFEYSLRAEGYMARVIRTPLVRKSYVNRTFKYILGDLFTTAGLTDFDATTWVDTGSTFTLFSTNGETLASVINRLVTLQSDAVGAAWAWHIDGRKNVWAHLVSNVQSPFDVANAPTANWLTTYPPEENSVEARTDHADIRNRVTVRGGTIPSSNTTDTFTGDGATVWFQLSYRPIRDIISITVGGVAKSYGTMWYNAEGGSYDCLVNYSAGTVKFPDASPPGAVSIVVTYRYDRALVVTRSDSTSQAIYGYWFDYEYEDRSISSETEATALADAILALYAYGTTTGAFTVRKHGLRAGQEINLSLYGYGLFGNYVIRGVVYEIAASGLYILCRIEVGDRTSLFGEVFGGQATIRSPYAQTTTPNIDGEVGTIRVRTAILGGAASSYSSGDGFFLGNDSGTQKFRVGSASAGRLTWDGSTLSLGGWTIEQSRLIGGSGATTVGLDTGGSNPAIYAGSATPGSAPFRVTAAGAMTATSGTIGGFTIATNYLASGNFKLDAANKRLYMGTGSQYFSWDSPGGYLYWNSSLGIYDSFSAYEGNFQAAMSVTGKVSIFDSYATFGSASATSYDVTVYGKVIVKAATQMDSTLDHNGSYAGFFSATPIAQPTTGIAAATFTANSGTAVNDASTFDGYTIKQVVKALRNLGLLA